MIVRVIQMVNNIFKDETGCGEGDKEKPLGEYCVFGYFDAMSIGQPRSMDKDVRTWEILGNEDVNGLNSYCTKKNIICISSSEEKEKDFWEKSEVYPLLFVSTIRLNDEESNKTIHTTVEQLNNFDKCIVYYSFEHSELVVINMEEQYTKGVESVCKIYDYFKVLNIYTIFSVKESMLSSEGQENKVIDENVKCRLRAVIKDENSVNSFLKDLKAELFGSVKSKDNIHVYNALGNMDILIELNDVSFCKLLSCYRMGALLTHTNPKYDEAFYNVETEILGLERKIS